MLVEVFSQVRQSHSLQEQQKEAEAKAAADEARGAGPHPEAHKPKRRQRAEDEGEEDGDEDMEQSFIPEAVLGNVPTELRDQIQPELREALLAAIGTLSGAAQSG